MNKPIVSKWGKKALIPYQWQDVSWCLGYYHLLQEDVIELYLNGYIEIKYKPEYWAYQAGKKRNEERYVYYKDPTNGKEFRFIRFVEGKEVPEGYLLFGTDEAFQYLQSERAGA